jgi:uridine kinase
MNDGGQSPQRWRIADLARLVETARPPHGVRTKIVAIDGGGGAGKSLLASRLAAALGDAPIVRTDDFASWDDQEHWWPRVVDQVLQPLACGETARCQRYDWEQRRLAGWVELGARPPIVLLEGVTATRKEFDASLAVRVWVDTPRDLRLQRGLARDGTHMRSQWLVWMAGEDRYVQRDRPVERADVVVSGEPGPSPSDGEILVLRRERA